MLDIIKYYSWEFVVMILYPFLKVFNWKNWKKYDILNYFSEFLILIIFLWLLWTWIELIPNLYNHYIENKEFNLNYKILSISIYTYYIALIPSFFSYLDIKKNNSYYYFFTIFIAIIWFGTWFLPNKVIVIWFYINLIFLYISISLWTKHNIDDVRFDIKNYGEQFIITK